MTSLIVVFILVVLAVWLADSASEHDGIIILIRSVALLVLIAWILNVGGCIYLPVRPW